MTYTYMVESWPICGSTWNINLLPRSYCALRLSDFTASKTVPCKRLTYFAMDCPEQWIPSVDQSETGLRWGIFPLALVNVKPCCLLKIKKCTWLSQDSLTLSLYMVMFWKNTSPSGHDSPAVLGRTALMMTLSAVEFRANWIVWYARDSAVGRSTVCRRARSFDPMSMINTLGEMDDR